jgi:AcrR family transcriptional regulator
LLLTAIVDRQGATTIRVSDARKTPRQQRSQALVDAILTAVSRVLESGGARRATTTRIAERAGVSIGSLYQYLRDRDELLGAFVDRRLEDNLRRFEYELDASDASHPRATIEACVRA